MDVIVPPEEVAALLGSNDLLLTHPLTFPSQNLSCVNAFITVCASAAF